MWWNRSCRMDSWGGFMKDSRVFRKEIEKIAKEVFGC